MDVRVGPWRKLSPEEMMLLNCDVGERLLRVPWTARRSNQSILEEISPEYSLEKTDAKLQYFGHLMGRADSLEKTLMLRKIEGRSRRMRWLRWHHHLNRGWDGWMASLTWWMSLCKLWKLVMDREAWCCKESDRIEWLNWLRHQKKKKKGQWIFIYY